MDRRTFIGVSTAAAVTPIPTLAKTERPYFMLPDLVRDVTTKTLHENCYTIHHTWMMRWWKDGRMESAHVNTKRYREWLADLARYEPDALPPHIQFGGAQISNPAGDPTFHARWVAFAKATFV